MISGCGRRDDAPTQPPYEIGNDADPETARGIFRVRADGLGPRSSDIIWKPFPAIQHLEDELSWACGVIQPFGPCSETDLAAER
jgi:hypothetical protein